MFTPLPSICARQPLMAKIALPRSCTSPSSPQIAKLLAAKHQPRMPTCVFRYELDMKACAAVQVEKLYFASIADMKAILRSKRSTMLQSMRDMPDHNLSVRNLLTSIQPLQPQLWQCRWAILPYIDRRLPIMPDAFMPKYCTPFKLAACNHFHLNDNVR